MEPHVNDELMAIIGGTALTDAGWLNAGPPRVVHTSYGPAEVQEGRLDGRPVVFLARHGNPHRLLPPEVNYRANVDALRRLGVRRILATSAVGGVAPNLAVGDLVAVDQLVDFTRTRASSFGERSVDVSDPYCPAVRSAYVEGGSTLGVPVRDGGTYVCTEGPRYETAAEIRLFAAWGMDVVGMTNAPEAFLAREAGLCYATLCVVTNRAAGTSSVPLSLATHGSVVRDRAAAMRSVLAAAVERLDASPGACGCAGLTKQEVRA